MGKNKKSSSMSQRKQINKKIDKMYSNVEQSKSYIIKIILAVLVFLGIFFLLTVYITNKDDSSTTNNSSQNKTTTIQYEKILAGSSFGMGDDYLVLYYDQSNEELKTTLSSKVTSYKEKESHLGLYTVDLSNFFNKGIVSDDVNKEPTEASELRLQSPTLIHFKDGQVSEYIEGEDSISDYLN